MNLSVIATVTATAALIAAPATASADPVPTTDQVVAIMAALTDPGIPAANKTNIVTPGFAPEEAQKLDDRLNRMRGPALPEHFVVTNIQPAPNNLAGVTLATTGWPRQNSYGRPIVLVNQGGRWLVTHDSAMTELDVFWRAANRYRFY